MVSLREVELVGKLEGKSSKLFCQSTERLEVARKKIEVHAIYETLAGCTVLTAGKNSFL